MRVVEYWPGEELIIEVPSRRPGRRFHHRINLHLNEDGDVVSAACSCNGWSTREACRPVLGLWDVTRARRDEA